MSLKSLSKHPFSNFSICFLFSGKGGKKKKKGKKKKEEEPKRKIELVADPDDKEEWKKFLNKTQETVAKTKKTLEILR